MSLIADLCLEEPVEFFLRRLGKCICGIRISRRCAGICVFLLFAAASTFVFSLDLFVHLSLTLGERILILCDGISP
jgi:hypothetical protein